MLLFGIVIAGAAILFVSGSAVTQTVQDTNELRSAEIAMSNVDSELGSLSMADADTGQQLDLGSMSADDAIITRTGEIRVSVNDTSACAATIPLTALEYHHESGTTIVYESGAVWRADEDGGVSQLSPPGVRYREQTLQLSLVNLSGSVDDSTIDVRRNGTRSAAMSNAVRDQLFAGSCGNPDGFDNLTLTVTSSYHEAWQRHLEAEFGESQVTATGPETVAVEIPRSMLPPEYDNRRNTVVDFTDGRLETGTIGSEGTLGLAAAGGDDDVFGIDKGQGNSYESTLTLLGGANANATSDAVEEDSPGDPLRGWNNSTVALTGNGTVELVHEAPIYEQHTEWNNWTEEVPTNETLEIVFVMDESGSMGDGSKMEAAREAAHEFIDVVEATTNGTEPRYSVVGYTSNEPCYRSDWYRDYHRGQYRWVCAADTPAEVVQHHPLNTDEQGAHDAIDGLEPQGNTPISQSIEEASNILQTEGNSSNEQFIVLLTDGQHNIDDDPNGYVRWPDEAAAQEVPDGVTLHAVGLGEPSSRADEILAATAGATDGGEYYPVSDSDDLAETFEDIAENVSTQTVYHNESYNVTELVGIEETTETVTVTEDGEFAVNLSATRTLTEAEAENRSVGDTVWVNGTDAVAIDENETVELEFTVQRFSNASNSTYTTTVTRDVDLSYEGTVSGDVNDTVTIQDRHLDTDTTYRRYLLHPRATLAVETGGSATTLWDGRNLNNWTADGVTLGSFEREQFSLVDGAETAFEPTFRECTANRTTGGVVTIDGTDYQQTYCTAAGSPLLSDSEKEVHIYANDSQILANASLSWQESVREMLDTPDGQYYRETPAGDLYTDLPCDNQAIVVVEATDNGTDADANNMVFLAEVGRCAEDVDMSYLVGVDVSVVSTGDNSTRVVAASPTAAGDAVALLSVDAPAPETVDVRTPVHERAG